MCPRCGHRHAYDIEKQRLWQCAACRHQVSLTSGTVLHNTKTPLTVWFWAAYLMTTDKRGVSAAFLQRQLGLSRYETAWMMLHKLRRAMVNATRESLHGEVEVDDTWIGGPQAGLRGSRQLKGRRAALVLVAVEKRGKGSGRVRMAVIPNFRKATITKVLAQNVDTRLDNLHRWPEGLRWARRGRLQTYPSHSTSPDRVAERREVSSATGRPRNWQLEAMAAWHLPRREPRSASGLPRRVRVSTQSPEDPDGGIPNSARSWNPPRPNALRPHKRRERSKENVT